MELVIERNNNILLGPTIWNRELQRLVGMEGNSSPPDLPYSRGGYTLRQVVYDNKNDFQEYDEGAVDGDVWRFGVRLKSLGDLKEYAKDQINGIHNTKNFESELLNRQNTRATFESDVNNNWARRKSLLDSVDSATNLSEINTVWQSRTQGWSQ